MRSTRPTRRLLAQDLLGIGMSCCLLAALASCSNARSDEADKETEAIPKVGGKAADFTLMDLEENKVTLSKLIKEGPVALVVLRGYPGYQ